MSIDDFRAISLDSVIRAASNATDSHAAFISTVAEERAVAVGSVGAELFGVPFAVKDNIDVVGMPTTGGTEVLRGFHPNATASVVTRLCEAGAVVIGKSNLHELAFGITSNNGSFGAVRNPFDRERSAGGSSGGSAVAVALGIVPFALGTDTGGSMQIPAAHCGIVGMRPTTGRYPSDGVLRLSSMRDTIGVMATTVADVARVDAIITGEAGSMDTDNTAVRLGVPSREFFAGVDVRITGEFAALREVLHSAGVTMVEIDFGPVQALAEACGTPITLYESEREILAYLTTLPAPNNSLELKDVRDASLSPDVRGILDHILGTPVTEAQYQEACEQRSELQAVLSVILASNRLDALFYPTVPILAPPLGDDATTLLNGQQVPVFDVTIRHTAPGSLAGLPAISIPGGLIAGLPFGVTLESEPGSDRRLLSLAGSVSTLLADRAAV